MTDACLYPTMMPLCLEGYWTGGLMSVLGQYSSTFPYFIYGLLKYVLIKSIRIHFPFIVGVGHVEEDSGCRAYTESGAGQRRQRRTWNFYHGKTLVELIQLCLYFISLESQIT